MSDTSQREWRFYLDDMIDFAGKVLVYTDGLDQAGFVASGLTYDASWIQTPRPSFRPASAYVTLGLGLSLAVVIR